MWFLLAAIAATPSYTLSFPDRQAHLLQVEATLDATGDRTELFMATWTPGSYLIREFARHIEGLEALGPDGEPLHVHKTRKNRWEVDTTEVSSITLRYRLYSRSMNVRANFVDEDFAVLNGAPTFIVPADLQGPYSITVERPAGWARTLTQLSPEDSDSFTAPSYDLLVDSPIVVGNPSVQRFEVDGVEHLLVDLPDTAPWDSEKAAVAVKRAVEAQREFWGQIPYERYLFLNVLSESRGGLEHLGSTLMMTSRFNTLEDEPFQSWLGLVAHEHFHAWNVKRLRPRALGPFDYQDEVYTESLWIAEGFTSYYDDVLLSRAGLIDSDEYLERMSKNLSRLQSTPGRLQQPLSHASYDAWIKYYRGDENSVNTAISYYTKGAVVAWVIDARIRTLTGNQRSLDDAMRLAYTRYSGDQGYTPEQFVELLSEVAGSDLAPFIEQLVDRPGEVDTSEAIALFGLQLSPPSEDEPTPWLGIEMGGSVVKSVRRDGPSWEAGLNFEDEILAIDGDRTRNPLSVLDRYQPGDTVELLISRRGRIRTVEVRLGTQPADPKLSIDDKARKSAVKRRESWIGERG